MTWAHMTLSPGRPMVRASLQKSKGCVFDSGLGLRISFLNFFEQFSELNHLLLNIYQAASQFNKL